MTSKKKTPSKKKPTRSKKSKETKSSDRLGANKGSKNVKSDTKQTVSKGDGRKTNNLSRVNRIRKTNADEIRKKFKAIEYVRQLEQSAERLEAIVDNLNIAKQLKAKLTVKDIKKISAIRMQIDVLMMQRDTIKVQIDLNLRRLKYCIPELKAMELSDPDGKNPFMSMALQLREALSK